MCPNCTGKQVCTPTDRACDASFPEISCNLLFHLPRNFTLGENPQYVAAWSLCLIRLKVPQSPHYTEDQKRQDFEILILHGTPE